MPSVTWPLFVLGGLFLTVAPLTTSVVLPDRPAQTASNPTSDMEGFVSVKSFQRLAAEAKTNPQTDQGEVGLPVRLTIPSIKLDTAIESVGLTTRGAMATPTRLDDVAWFAPGSRPGQIGSAVLAGHYGWQDGKPGAFQRLAKLRPGDTVVVENANGTTQSFVVRGLRRYDPKADAAEVFGASDGTAHLNLITCEGVWDEVTHSYPQRLVVFTDQE